MNAMKWYGRSGFRMLVAGCLIATVASGWAPAAPGPEEPTVPKELRGYRKRLIEVMKGLRVPGIAVAVVKDGKIIYLDAVGERDPDKHLPVTPDTVFYIASCTKTFVATAILSLAADGKIDLDAPVRRYLPRFELADAETTKSITIRDLLAHAKGLNCGPVVWLDAYTGEITEDRYYRWLRDATPSGSHRYTNVHYTLLGRVIEAVSGKPWKDFLDERVFGPAGMKRSTGYASKLYGHVDAAIPSIRKGDGFTAAAVRKTDNTMHAAGGTGASVRDLARWILLNLNGGTIDGVTVLPRKWMSQMHKLQDAGPQPLPSFVPRTRDGHGFAWWVGTYRGNAFLEHGGGYVGTAASISFMPQKNMGVAVVANADGAAAQFVTMEIYDRLLGVEGKDLLPRFSGFIDARLARTRQKTPGNPNPAENGLPLPASAYVGAYEHKDWGTIHVRYAGGKIVGTQGALSLSFESTGKDAFMLSYGTGEPDQGRCDIKDGRVCAIMLQLYDEPYRFVRE